MFVIVEGVCNEFCVQIKGFVCNCLEGMVNVGLKSGKIEVLCYELNVLNVLVMLLFQFDDDNLLEMMCFMYCVFDLCCLQMQYNLCLCYCVVIEVCKYFDEQGFIDIEMLMLMKSMLEGVCDYFVLLCVNVGQFFVLLQLLQLFKQLLMVVNFDCYYQIIKCFCDEDFCVDCQLEFMQIDCEMLFFGEQEICDLFEDMICYIFKMMIDVEFDVKFLVMLYLEVMVCFGLDKLDLCVQFEFIELIDVMKDVDFKVFSMLVNVKDGWVVVLCVLKGGELLCGDIDGYMEFVCIYGVKGFVWIKVNEKVKGCDGLQSLIVKNLYDVLIVVIFECIGVEDGDIIFFVVDCVKVVNDSFGVLCLKIGYLEFGKVNGFVQVGWKLLWVVDFLMFEYDDEDVCYVVVYYLFMSLKDEYFEYFEIDLGCCFVKVYDMVLNGWEIGGGLVCIYCEEVQSKVFCVLKIGVEEVQVKFGFLLDVLQYGVLLYGGIVFGFDCIVMMMVGVDLICDVIVFLKMQCVQDLFMQVLSLVDECQLCELYICLCQLEQLKV